jgi:hypothetical protein
MCKAGISAVAIADEFGLTPARIYQIVGRANPEANAA